PRFKPGATDREGRSRAKLSFYYAAARRTVVAFTSSRVSAPLRLAEGSKGSREGPNGCQRAEGTKIRGFDV
ncbi:MAG: hypothetical protein EBS07_11995, partial [Sphingobacteriia bacterium]|nr:hypothetical protein [Sphingobacteriia bacterium]